MARKTTATNKTTTARTTQPAPMLADPATMNAAVKDAFGAMGDTAGKAQVADWLARNRPAVRFDDDRLTAAITAIRKTLDSNPPAPEPAPDKDFADRQDGADDNGDSDNEDTGHDKDSDGSDMSTADLVRSALEALGLDSGINAVEPWIKENYPGHKYNRGTLGSTISNIRKKIEGGDTGGGGRRTSNKTPAPFVPSTTDMSTLQTLVRDSKLSLTEFENTVRQVQGWADQCGAGSIGNLLKTAEALRAFLTSMQNIRL